MGSPDIVSKNQDISSESAFFFFLTKAVRTADQTQIERIERRRENTHIMLVEVLQNTFPLREDKFSVEVLPVVSASFPQKPLSVACRGRGEATRVPFH